MLKRRFFFTLSSLLIATQVLVGQEDRSDEVRERVRSFSREQRQERQRARSERQESRRAAIMEERQRREQDYPRPSSRMRPDLQPRQERQRARSEWRERRRAAIMEERQRRERDYPRPSGRTRPDLQPRQERQRARSEWRERRRAAIMEERQRRERDYPRPSGRTRPSDREQRRPAPDQQREERRDRRSFEERVRDYFYGPRKGRVSKKELRKRKSHWEARARSFRKGFERKHRHHHIFDDHYWHRFRRHHRWYFDDDFFWYGVVSWPRIAIWLPWGWGPSIYYYYDDDGIYYGREDDSYYFPVTEDFEVDAVALANSAPFFSKDPRDWMSLGIFGIFKEGESTEELPQEYVSIAISKDGAVSGAYVNLMDNEPIQIEGAVDERSQRIAWKFVGKDWPVMETGLYNLTRDEASLLVHFSRFNREPMVIAKVN